MGCPGARARRRRFGHRERGSAAVETALVIPFLLLVIMGILTFGLGYSTKITLNAGVREGARTLALNGTDEEAIERVKALTLKLNPPISNEDVTIDRRCTQGDINGTAKLTVRHALTYNLLFTKGTWNISALGVMRCGL